MANFFSAAYWKALYFKAMGGQATAVDPNAMSGSFAGSASFTADLTSTGEAPQSDQAFDTHDGSPRRKQPIVIDMEEMRRRWAQEDQARQERARRQEADKAERRRVIAKAMGIEPEADEPEPTRLTIEDQQARLKALTALLDYPKPTLIRPSLIDFKGRRERKALIQADRKAREEARALAERIRQEIRDFDDAIILLLLAA